MTLRLLARAAAGWLTLTEWEGHMTWSGTDDTSSICSVASAAKLPDEEQNVLAAILLEEMESEGRWSALFAGSQNLLQQMASEAIKISRLAECSPSTSCSEFSYN